MTELRSVRIAVSLTPREHDALRESAHRQRVPIAQVAARMIRSHLAGGGTEAAPPPAPPAPPAPDAPERTEAPGPMRGPAWLPPLDRASHAEWVRDRAAAVQSLLERYPGELAALSDGWAADPAVREQLWALSVWRDQLDTGLYDDPRAELAFAASVSDFAGYLQERDRSSLRRRA